MAEISVIVPVYNVEDYLEKCLDSLLNQTMTDFEILCVDDGSTDHSNEILYLYRNRDPRIRILEKTNGGLSDARNYGMKAASAPVVMFVDSDDFLEPQALEKAYARMKETDADMVIFDVYQYFMKTGKKEIIANQYNGERTYSLQQNPELMTRILNCAWNKMVRLSLFTDHHIEYPKGYLYEDLGTTYKLVLKARKIAFVNEPLYNYLADRPGNITQSFDRKAYHILDMSREILDYYRAEGVFEQYREELKFLVCVNIIENLKKTRNVRDRRLVNEYIDACFAFIRTQFPDYPQCRYPIRRQKHDWIYMRPATLKLYLSVRKLLHR